MIEIYKSFWRNYSNFSGMATRKEYWITMLINFILYFVVTFVFGGIGAVLSNVNEDLAMIVTLVGVGGFCLGIIIPTFSILTRRFHDGNHSGWWVLLSMLPGLNIVGFVFTLLPSDHVNNKWAGTHNPGTTQFQYNSQDANEVVVQNDNEDDSQ